MRTSERTRRFDQGQEQRAAPAQAAARAAGQETRPVVSSQSRDRPRQARTGTDRHRWSAEHDALYDEAVQRFGTSCLWNASPSRSAEGLLTIARQLKANGGMEAWRCAERIERTMYDAPEHDAPG